MSEMVVFCKLCGSDVDTDIDIMFCPVCVELMVLSKADAPEEAVEESAQCNLCKDDIKEGEKFCEVCKSFNVTMTDERTSLKKKQDQEYRDSLNVDIRKKAGIKRCEICLNDYQPASDESVCRNCQIFIDVSKKEKTDQLEKEMPTDRRRRAEMLAAQFERLHKN